MATDTLNWGILGTGNIAGSFSGALGEARTVRLLAVASRSDAKAHAFADRHGVPRRYGSYQALLDDPDIDVVYVATPHPMHEEWVVRAARAGKHVLCEKPLGVNAGEVERMIAAARECGVFLMEAFMYRCSPQTTKIVELVKGGAVGTVRMIQASFGFRGEWDEHGRLLNPDLAGGGILDVGCYPMSFARLIAGVAQGRRHVDPIELKAIGHLERTGVDGYTAAVLRFPAPGGEIVAQVSCSVRVGQENAAVIYGTEGCLTVPAPWDGAIDGGETTLQLTRGPETRELCVRIDRPVYAIEADVVAEHLAKGQAPQMDWDDSRGNARALDLWREEVGVHYPFEEGDRGAAR